MECSIQLGYVASLNGTFHLSPNENILIIARINIHYLYTVVQFENFYRQILKFVSYHSTIFTIRVSYCHIEIRDQAVYIGVWEND